MKDIIIIGAGGVGRETAQLIEDINQENSEWNILGFVDDNPDLMGKEVNDYRIIGHIDVLNNIEKKTYVICTISAPAIKKKVISKIINDKIIFANLIHPKAVVSTHAVLGKDIIIQAFCVVSPNVIIGDHVQLNPQCGIGHESIIKRYSSLYWNVNVSGNVNIEEGSILGTKATVLQKKSIGEWSTVGANATVVTDIPPYCTAVGTPAKPIKYYKEV